MRQSATLDLVDKALGRQDRDFSAASRLPRGVANCVNLRGFWRRFRGIIPNDRERWALSEARQLNRSA
jgi:hypothetical protein